MDTRLFGIILHKREPHLKLGKLANGPEKLPGEAVVVTTKANINSQFQNPSILVFPMVADVTGRKWTKVHFSAATSAREEVRKGWPGQALA